MSSITGDGVIESLRGVDERLGSYGFIRRTINKIFPDNWSFMLGEIALYSFIILVITGTYLGLFFHPGETQVIYNGSYVPLKGVPVSTAYGSIIDISFDTRAGLLFRQIHHWAALLFVAAIVVHACRIFFTGAFRKPRETNWVIGVSLLVLGILEGFAGYSLPDDSLSGTGLRIAYSIVESIPVIGSYLAFLMWGSEFPGTGFNDRLFFLHVLVIPGVITALITAHLGILWHQKHTDFPGPGKSNRVIVGERIYPTYALKSLGLFAMVFGMLGVLGGLVQINPVWLYGPFDPASASTAAQPDWYVGFLEGTLRMMPDWEWRGWGHDIPFNVLVPAVILPAILFTLMAIYPLLERVAQERILKKPIQIHHELDNPREHPVRTGIGMMSLSFYLICLLAGGDDVLATTFHLSVEGVRDGLRVALIIVPPLAYKMTASWCRGLIQDDDDRVEEGIETGVIVMGGGGEYVEVVRPLEPAEPPDLVPHDERREPGYLPPATAELATQRRSGNGLQHAVGSARKAVTGFFTKEPNGD